MSREAAKTRRLWGPRELGYLKGRGIDIGCGDDPVLPGVRPFDKQHGDANRITEYVKERFDFVFSCHCLEHMDEPLAALQEWWKLVKPEGVLFLVVPDEDLYEQGFWPSRFNPDHKWTFTICKHQSWSPVSINLWEAVRSLPDSQIEDIRLQDNGYRRYLLANGSRPGSVAYIVKNLVGRLFYGLLKCTGIDKNRLREWLRHPVDQTKWADRCAQIQCIVRKVSTTA